MTREEKVLQLKQDFDEVYEAGKQAEYDAFWDVFQANGNRKVYYYAFNGVYGGIGWNDKIYNPKYEINCTGQADAGAYCLFVHNSVLTDTKVPIDVRGNVMRETFYGCTSLKRIPLLKVNAQTTWILSFGSCRELEDLTIEGTIGQSGLDLHWSTKLSKASIISVMNALSTTTSGLSIILPKTAVDREFEEGDRLGSDSQEWEEILQNHSNWTISLV